MIESAQCIAIARHAQQVACSVYPDTPNNKTLKRQTIIDAGRLAVHEIGHVSAVRALGGTITEVIFYYDGMGLNGGQTEYRIRQDLGNPDALTLIALAGAAMEIRLLGDAHWQRCMDDREQSGLDPLTFRRRARMLAKETKLLRVAGVIPSLQLVELTR